MEFRCSSMRGFQSGATDASSAVAPLSSLQLAGSVQKAICLLVVFFLLPAHAQPVLSPPTKLPGGGYRVTWTTVPGKTYQLERAANDKLSATNWMPLATVPASLAVTFFDDTAPGSQRFYRVR